MSTRRFISRKEIDPLQKMNDKKPINNILNLYVPSGWGDLCWLLCKIYNNTTKDIHLHTFPRHVYSAPVLYNLPRIKLITQNNPYKSYNQFLQKCKQEYNNYKNLDNINNLNEMYLEMNTWVDNGNYLKDYLPKLETTYELPWVEYNQDEMNNEFGDDKIILIYTSALNNNRMGRNHTGNFKMDYWVELIKQLKNKYRVIWLGSKYDIDGLNYINNRLNNSLEYRLDKNLDYIHSLMKRSKALISYQSGLSCHPILNKTCPTNMLYFNCLPKLPNMICHPDWINNKNYYFEFFDTFTIEKTLNWVESL